MPFPRGAVPKWLREQSAKLRCSGSNPLGASKQSLLVPLRSITSQRIGTLPPVGSNSSLRANRRLFRRSLSSLSRRLDSFNILC